MKKSVRRILAAFFLFALLIAAIQVGCGNEGPASTYPSDPQEDGATPGPGPGPFPNNELDGSVNDADPDALGTLIVTPATATVTVTIVNGVVTAPPQPFVATYNGQQVPATWLFDRGELGDFDANGVFKANGKNVGEGTVTARYGAREGTATLKVVVTQTQNGAPADVDAGGGFGGIGGVGGEPQGPAVDAATVTKLKGAATALPDADLAFLYPYDKTVWPRGLLPPLLMWRTTKEATSVYVKLSQSNFTFEGTYSVAGHPAGSDARKRVRLDDLPWRIATGGNQGDDLKLEVKIYSTADDKVYGPITRSWKVAPGVLKGTVYYNSYESALTIVNNKKSGGVIAIKPRSPEPALALGAAGMTGKCHVCHELSADGSTLWAQDALPGDNYEDGASYDLTKNPPTRTAYKSSNPGGNPANDRKFVWSGPYPDGSFALASSRFAREAYTQTDAKLFTRADGSQIPDGNTTGLNVITSAVTPAYSPDGRKVVFNFWEGTGANGVTAGDGRSLAVFDFTCGAPAGSTKCPSGATYAFSGLREIYKDGARWPAWPSFLPDNKAVVFQSQINGGACGPGTIDRASIHNCQITTWFNATAEIWIAKDVAPADARRLDALNGIANGVSYLPTDANHPDDTKVNYMPTVNPVASGGYYWVVFTSRRLYGNVLTKHPWNGTDENNVPVTGMGSAQKKLWVAAIDINAPAGADPSHPAFYLPGQELEAGNARGFWVVDPCKPNGTSCETGDECCNGFCRKDPDGGALVCSDKPPGSVCSQEFEKCTVNADCCDPKFQCIAGKCTRPDPVVK